MKENFEQNIFNILSYIKFSTFFRAFDVELLYIAQHFKIPVSEVAVRWTEIDGEDKIFFSDTFYNIPFYSRIKNCSCLELAPNGP